MGYFFVWTLFGVVAFPLGVALTAMWMQHPALAGNAPIAIGMVVLMAGAFQLTTMKTRHLAYCAESPGPGCTLCAGYRVAWEHGLRLGVHCSQCCVGLMVVLLVIGVMNVAAMAIVATAITVERLAPAGKRLARATGAGIIGAGLVLIGRAVGLG